ncbi:hypothetical protein ML462_15775 [Gramella lutea]|uniref:Uncharacterized protein n=1 Tax=Christiangramia lutea TaxID=1607951 RepID=A0A9X1V929_9FLAO|nr:hypothetical protein [Christiangramia lutea]MCH4824633.1 hypothetical protein [Christiangramia lutea]
MAASFMRKILLIIILLTSIKTNADGFEVLFSKFSKAKNIAQVDSLLNQEFDNFVIDSEGLNIYRNLDSNFKQMIYGFSIRYKEEGFYEEFKIYIVTDQDNKIVFGKLEEFEYPEKIIQSEIFNIQVNQIEKYLIEHQNIYDLKLEEKNFIEQFETLKLFGFGCSESMDYYPKEAKKMMKLVDRKDYKELAFWLRQISPELQAYGLTGLIELEKEGIKIQPEERKIIEHLKNRNTPINNCSGCLYGLKTPIKELIY